MLPLICFVSDFGIGDTWVGVCHAVIHRACQQVRVVDLSHAVPAFDVRQGAVVATEGVHQIPDAIHLVVVDPGVGGGRRDLCLVCESGTRLVGPDNGVLIAAARRCGGVRAAYALDPGKIDVRRPLATFHARDVLAPAAAALACGVAPDSLGDPVVPSMLVAAPFEECVAEDGVLYAEALGSDRFGSVRFNVTAEHVEELLSSARSILLSFHGGELRVPLRMTFSDVPPHEPVALVDSSGWLTLAVNLGSAVDAFGIHPCDRVTIRAAH